MTSRRVWILVPTLGIMLWIAVLAAVRCAESEGDPRITEQWEPVPPVVTPGIGALPPSDAIVLFDGHDLSQWRSKDDGMADWPVADGAFTVAKDGGDLYTKRSFGDCQLHIEWRTPVEIAGEGQARGNSGVFLQERYEIQILDSYDNRTYANGQAASIYKQHIPLVNASRKPGEWQTYDIIFGAPRFAEDGALVSSAYMTVLHNGVLVQNHVEIKGSTAFIGEPGYQRHPPKAPLRLQNHGDPVSYRNIWIREL